MEITFVNYEKNKENSEKKGKTSLHAIGISNFFSFYFCFNKK